MKDYLIFTGIGDISTQYKTWFEYDSAVYDKAVFYFGEQEDFLVNLQKNSAVFIEESKGMIFTNFVKFYKHFKDYKYVLIIDSDLELKPKEIEDAFLQAQKNQWSGCQFSRAEHSYGVFQPLYQTRNQNIRETNFIEMLFMLLRKDILKELVYTFQQANLIYSSGVDLILMNIAYKKKYPPFIIFDNYTIYNPWPTDKRDGREIDKIAEWSERIYRLKLFLKRKKYRFNFKNFHYHIWCGDEYFKNN